MAGRLFSHRFRFAAAVLVFPFLAMTVGDTPELASPSRILANRISSMHPILFRGVSIENFGIVDGRIYRGAQPERNDYAELASIGVKTIIDLRGDAIKSARRDAQANGLKYINIGMDSHGMPSDAQTAEFLKDVDDPANGVVYVHCEGGRHRTGSMIAIYRMEHDGWTLDKAYSEMLAYDFYTIGGHGGIKTYVYDYYHRMTTNPASVPVEYGARTGIQ